MNNDFDLFFRRPLLYFCGAFASILKLESQTNTIPLQNLPIVIHCKMKVI